MSLKSNFIQKIRQIVVAGINRTNRILRISNIIDGVNRIIHNKRFNRPMLVPEDLKRFEKPPSEIVRKHNKNLDELRGDVDILNNTVSELYTKQSLIRVLRSNAANIMNRMFTIIKDKIKELRRTYLINVQSIIENFETSDNIESLDGAVVDTGQGIATLLQPISPISSVTPDEGDVRIEVLNNITFSTPRNENDVLDITNTNNIQFVAISTIREQVTYKANITFQNRPINQVAVTIDNKVPLTATIRVNGKEKASRQVLLKGTYLFSFKEVVNANLVEIFMLAENEDYVRDEQYVYALNLIHINIRNAARNLSGTIISKELQFDAPITDIAIKTDDYVPARSNIKYFVADSNTPDNWVRVRPTHSMYDEQFWVAIGKKSEVNKIVEVDHRIPPIDNVGNSMLYNILDGLTEENISEGKLIIPENWTVDTNKSTIHMGVNDYIIDYDYLKIKNKSRITPYKFQKESSEYVDMTTQIEQETHLVVDNDITLKYTPVDTDLIISDKTDTYGSFSVNGKRVTIQDITNGTTVYVTYRAKVKEMETVDERDIEIIPSSLKVRAAPSADVDPFIEVVDVLFDEKKIRLLPNAGIPLDNTEQYYVAYISFDYYLKTREKFRMYKTNLFYTSPTDITILPFTDEEVDVGNMHVIDGNVVSRRVEYAMDRGWHTVVTTQPFPSNEDNPNDYNVLTNKPSGAGIVLRGFDKMYAYRQPMRYVSLHRLSNVVSRHDHRSFTINEGEILVNFSPDVLIEPTMDGEIVIGRTVEWFGKKVRRYKLNGPQFEVHVVLKPTENDETNKVDSVKYKIEITRTPTSTAPAVSVLEVYGV